MASPFSVFRRHQRAMLAACAILAMIAFVFLGPIMDYFGGRGGQSQANPVVVSWNHGDLRESQMLYLMSLANATNQFLEMAYRTAEASGATPERPLLINVSEQSVVQTSVLSKAAEQQGMVMSDGMINAYLRRITANAVNADQFNEILNQVSVANRKATMQNIFDELRRRLLSQQMVRLYESWSYGVPPGERWSYFLKLNQQALVDVVPVTAESQLSQVREPTNEEVLTLYERYKNVISRPVLVSGTPLNPPNPGFRQPSRAQFQYFKANFDEFVQVAQAQITDAEIEKYYNENKALFPAGSAAFIDQPEAAPSGDQPAEGKTETPADVAPDPFAPAGDGKTEPPADAPKADGAAEPKAEVPATEAPATPPTSETPPPAEPKTDAAPPAAPPSEATPAPDQSSLSPPAWRPGMLSTLTGIALVALQAEPPKADAAAPASEPAAPAAEAGSTPPAAEKTATSAAPAADNAVPPPLLADPAAAAAAAATAAAPEPLEKVRETIRTRLARERAAEEINRIFSQIEEVMNRYSSEFVLWQTTQQDGGKVPPPTPPDLDALAKKYGVAAVTLNPMSVLELDRDTDLGKSYELRLVQGYPMPGQRFLNLTFGPTFPVFRPVRSTDDDQNQFLAWKTANMPDYTPPLDKIRGDVVRAWKLIEAREFVRKRAESLADRARQDKDKTMRQTLSAEPGVEVVEPDPFTWLTLGSVPFDMSNMQAARLTPIVQLNNTGPEFMQKVFSLKEGEIGVAWNFPQSVMYVIQLKKFEESEAVLHARFMSYNFERYAAAGLDLSEKMQQRWLGMIQAEQGLKWERPPHNGVR